jgi:hypothetical protein
MKKISTVRVNGNMIFKGHKLTIGVDLGDRWSCYCVLDEAGEILLEQKVATTPEAMKQIFDAVISRFGEPSTHVVCVAMTSLRIMLNCGVAEPSSALAAVPKVLARQYSGTIRCRRFAQYPSPSSVCGNEGRSEAPVASKRVI